MRAARRTNGRSIVGGLLASLAVLLGTAGLALGHAELDTVSPADGSIVSAAPNQIVMTFTEALNPAKSSIVLVDGAGSTIAQGGSVSPTAPKQMTLDLPGLVPGAYQVRWTSASAADGDIARGTTSFTYSAPSPPPTEAPSPSASPSAPSSAGVSAEPSLAATPTPSLSPSSPTASTTDALIPLLVVVIAVLAVGAWLLRGRSRRPG